MEVNGIDPFPSESIPWFLGAVEHAHVVVFFAYDDSFARMDSIILG
jgi:hypothetical protein